MDQEVEERLAALRAAMVALSLSFSESGSTHKPRWAELLQAFRFECTADRFPFAADEILEILKNVNPLLPTEPPPKKPVLRVIAGGKTG